MDVVLLGPLRVSLDDGPEVAFEPETARALLAVPALVPSPVVGSDGAVRG